MILKIRTAHNKYYESACFGIVGNSLEKLAIVFNEEKTNLILSQFWQKKKSSPKQGSLHTKIFYKDASKKDWTSISETLQGIEWIVSNEEVMYNLSEQEQVNKSIINRAKLYEQSLDNPEFFELKSKSDTENASVCSNHLKDAFLTKIVEDEDTVTFIFDTTWDYDFILKCEKKSLKHNLAVDEHSFLYCANFDFQNDTIIIDFEIHTSDGTKNAHLETKNASFTINTHDLDKDLFNDLGLL